MKENPNKTDGVPNLPTVFCDERNFRVYMLKMAGTVGNRRDEETSGLTLLVKHVFGPDSSLVYDEFGKPWPANSGNAISVTHSSGRIAMIVSENFLPGIDIEPARPELEKIRSKLLHFSEVDFLNSHVDRQWVLQVIWGAKEAVYKSYGKKKLIFKDDMIVQPFSERPETSLKLVLKKHGESWEYSLKAVFTDGYYLVYTTGCVKL